MAWCDKRFGARLAMSPTPSRVVLVRARRRPVHLLLGMKEGCSGEKVLGRER